MLATPIPMTVPPSSKGLGPSPPKPTMSSPTPTTATAITILSMVIAVAVVGVGLLIVGFGGEGPSPLLLGGTVIGIGVASMHYMGMWAMRMPDTMGYDTGLLA